MIETVGKTIGLSEDGETIRPDTKAESWQVVAETEEGFDIEILN